MASSTRSDSDLQDIRSFVYLKASEQGGVFRRSDLSIWGVDPDLVRLFTRRRYWVRLKHGCYADATTFEATLSDEMARHTVECMLAVRALRSPAYAFATSAAHLHELFVPRELHGAHAEIVRPAASETRDRSRKFPALPNVRIRTLALTDVDTEVAHGIPTVSRTGAALSTAAQVELEWAVAILDSGAWGRNESLASYQQLLVQWPMLNGLGTLRRAVPLARSGAQSPLESISRMKFLNHGLPEPELQVQFRDRSGLIGYVDMYWPDFKVIGEADGLAKYEVRENLIAEKLREDRLRALGFSVVRWTWDEILNSTPAVVARIRQGARLATSIA